MATIAISRTVSAAHLTRAVAALRSKFALPVSATNADVQAAWEASVWAGLIGIVKDYERQQAAQTAADAITEIGLT